MSRDSKVISSVVVANLHIRDVPEDVVRALKNRAERAGRSLNSEVVRALTDAAGRRTREDVLESIRRHRKWDSWPVDLPTPEELIRRDRDSR